MGLPNLNPEKANTELGLQSDTKNKWDRYVNTSNQYYQGCYFINKRQESQETIKILMAF